MKAYILLPVFMLIAYCSLAQDKFPFVARTSDELLTPARDVNIKNVRVDNANELLVKTGKGYQTYNINDIFGYRNKRGNEYRIYNGEEYQVLALGNLCIYAHPVLLINMEEGNTYPVLKYYFSRRVYGAIFELTPDNIAHVFTPTNAKFVDLVRNYKWFAELTLFDRRAHEYKIEEVYKQSKNSNS